MLGIFATVLIVSGHGRAGAPFGDSHDGRNAGVWASGSRSLREDGPLTSRLGTWALVGGEERPYATHPPLIVVQTAAVEAVLGEHPWTTRLPAWGGTLASVVLAWFLLRACRLRPLAASIGVALGFGCPLIAVYGTMLDTPVTGFPFALGVLLLWQRGRTGRPAPDPLVATVAALAVLSSWQGLLVAGLVTGATVVTTSRRRQDTQRLPVSALLVGTAAGGLLLTGWVWWAYESLGPLLEQLAIRGGAGERQVGLDLLVAGLEAHWPRVLTPWLLALAIPALVAAVRRPHTRAVASVALAVVGVWVVVLRDGAVHHDYWAYWIVLPLALGLGTVADAALAALDGRRALAPVARTLSAAAVGLASLGVLGAGGTGAAVSRGAVGGGLLRATTYPSGQDTAWYLGELVQPASWVSYATRRPAVELVTHEDVRRVATSDPADLVLVHAGRLRRDLRGPAGAEGCRAGVPAGHDFAVVTAASLARALDDTETGCEAEAARSAGATDGGAARPNGR